MEQIDIIMPVYNGEAYIKDAIESVKNQTISNWNLMIVDDGSTDNTIKTIEATIADRKDKIVVIPQKEHKGVWYARNVGIQKSTNRYIAFLDADDIWQKDKLEKQIQFMKKNDYAFTYTRFTYLKNNTCKEVNDIPPCLTYQQALKNTYILTSTVILDTKTISKKDMMMPPIESEDTATWWKILKKQHIAYGYDENLTIYRVQPGSLSSNKFKNLRKTWRLYRRQEHIGIVKSIYYFLHYIYHAIKKRMA